MTARVLLNAKHAAEHVGLSIAAFWRQVSERRLPAPVYPSPRAPRWYQHELDAALEATRSTPREAMAARRSARLQNQRNSGDDQ